MALMIGFSLPPAAYAQSAEGNAARPEELRMLPGDIEGGLDDEFVSTGPVTARVTEGSYAIDANGLENLRRAVTEATTDLGAGVRAVASTRVDMTPKVETEQVGSSCAVTAASVDLETLVTLPQWRQFDYASDEEKSAWTRYVDALRAHENLHVAISEEWATRLLTTIAALPHQGTCADVRAEVDAALARVLERHNAAQLALDAQVRDAIAAR